METKNIVLLIGIVITIFLSYLTSLILKFGDTTITYNILIITLYIFVVFWIMGVVIFSIYRLITYVISKK